ncbi:hypothetical protein GCM10020000_34660 [Streptomyces olivoverticillatus]
MASLQADWPLVDGPVRWRQGEVTLRWDALAPGASGGSVPDPR